MKVVVAYHIVPNYRGPVVRALKASSKHEYLFLGSDADPEGSGRVSLQTEDPGLVVSAPTRRVLRYFFWQQAPVRQALRPDVGCLILLGDYRILSYWVAAMIGRLTGKRVLFWTHGWRRPDSGLRSFVRLAFYHLSHGLLLYGNEARRIGAEAGYPAERLHVIYNSLDREGQSALFERLAATYEPAPRGPDRPLLLYVGRLTAGKRLPAIVKAAARLREELPGLRLLFVGDGPEKEGLEERAEVLGVPVSFWGAEYEEDALAEAFLDADVTVCPGPIGLLALHSAAYGTPVVTLDEGSGHGPEFEALVPGVSVWTYSQDDPLGLETAIRQALGWTMSNPDARARVHGSLRACYSPSEQVERIERAIGGEMGCLA
jgi:glycosyltransferase involved in cell wall biosynthesis